MPEGPLGGPRPAARSSVVIYIRRQAGGRVGSEQTEPLQVNPRFSRELEERLKSRTEFGDTSVKFHPAGSVVGIEINTHLKEVNYRDIDEVDSVTQSYLEGTLGVPMPLAEGSRREGSIQIRAD